MSMCVCVCIPQLVDTQVAGAFTAGEKKAEWHLALCSWNRPVMANVTPTTLPHTNKQVFLIAPTHTAAMYFQIPWTQSLWECCFSPSGKLHWPLPLCTCLWGFICMQSYQMGAEVLAGWPAHTRRDTHTRSVAAFLPSFAVSSPSSPVVNKSRFHKAGCDRHSLKQTFHSALAAPLLSYSHRKQAHVCSGLFSLYILAINVNWCWSWCPIKSFKKKKKLNWKCQGTFTAARGRLWCKTVEPLSSFE